MTRTVLSLAVVAVVAAGLLYLRLLQGPLELPNLSRYIVDRINASSEKIRVDARTMVLELGKGRAPTGMEFRDVVIDTRDGKPLFVVPRVQARFHLGDLVHGLVRPVRVSVIDADAQFIRTADGRIRFGLGRGEGIALEEGGAATTPAGLEAVSNLIDGFVGDAEVASEMAVLERIEILQANIFFDDRLTGGKWAARGASLRIRRDRGGATAVLEVAEHRPDRRGTILRVAADRRQGTGKTQVAGQFGQIATKDLAGVLPALAVLATVDSHVEGEIATVFDKDGVPGKVAGVLIADGGVIHGSDGDFPFDMAALHLRSDLGTGRIEISEGLFSAKGFDARLGGIVHVDRRANGVVTALDAQLDIETLSIDRQDVFSGPVAFDDGQIVASWREGTDRVRIAESWLARDALVFRAKGRIGATDEGLWADLHAEASDLSVAELTGHWPIGAATNGRLWITENIPKATVEGMMAELRITPGSVEMSINAGFSGLEAHYLAGMSPISNARGDLHVSWNALYLMIDTGQVVPAGQGPISLAGSVLTIGDLWADIVPADISIRAEGATASILRLIDEEPLRLMQALGLELGGVRGQAKVVAALTFPLIDALTLRDVVFDVAGDLSNTALGLDLGEGRKVALEANSLNVHANPHGMRLSGDVRLDGAPARLVWAEGYGSRPGQRQISLSGQVTPKTLAAAGVDDGSFGGSAAVDLDLKQRGDAPMQFDLDANLARAELKIAPLAWSKSAGSPGRLKASGTIGATTMVEHLSIDADGLKAEGTLEIGASGVVSQARFERIEINDVLDAGLVMQRREDGVADLELRGRFLDVSSRFKSGDAAVRRDPFQLRLGLERLKITERIVVRVASGLFQRDRSGDLSGNITGTLGPDAPIAVAIDVPATGEGGVTLTSSNAGAALRAAGIYSDARGGKLHVDATLKDGDGFNLSGRARIEDVVVRSQSTFRDVLRDGGLEKVEADVAGSGIGFRKIWIPFVYKDGVVTVTDAIADSDALGLKMTGTLDERTELIDLAGVLSPGYVLTGAFNDIPLLGVILSGGRGEGILAMTFTLKGAMRDPEFSVNPLAMLAPGFLRTLFTGLGGGDNGEPNPLTEGRDTEHDR